MEPANRSRLLEKRHMIQLRQKRIDVSKTFRTVAAQLHDCGVKFSKRMPSQCRQALSDWTNAPGKDERIDWNQIPNGYCTRWSSTADRDDLFRLGMASCVDSDDKVVVIWHPCCAGMRIKADDLVMFPTPILDAADTIWIVADCGGGWLLEVCETDAEICFASDMSGIAEELT